MRFRCFPEFCEYGFFADVAAVRWILTEARNVKFIDSADFLADVVLLAEILRFFVARIDSKKRGFTATPKK